jgi:hypothetical protein
MAGSTISRRCALKAASISAHQARVARDINCEDCRKPTLDPRLGQSMRSGFSLESAAIEGR